MSLRGNKIGRKGGHLILNAENSALKKLDLSDNEIGFEGSQISLKSESSQLKELNIDNNPFTPQTLDKFLSGLKRNHNPLNLEFNVFNVKQLREVFLTILAHLKNIPIKKLTFINGYFSNHVGPIYIDLSDTLIEELVLTQLYINEECDVSFNFQNSVIKKINFIGNTLKEKDWDNLACALVGSTIERLEISFPNTCDQQKDILEGFFKKLANSSVKEIKIYSWGVEPPVLRKIIASFINTQIKHLDIFYQGLMNDSFLKTLTLRLGETPIEKLTLSSSYIDKNWLISLFIHLKGTKVNTLNIDGIVTDKKLKLNTLVKALEETSLTTIKGLGLEDYSEIRKALEKNKNTHVTPCTQILHQPFSLFSIKENPQNIESLKKHPAKPFI